MGSLRFSFVLVMPLIVSGFFIFPKGSMVAAREESAGQPAEQLETVYRCLFDESVDQNYDNWPDFWTRRSGRDYPKYVKSEIVAEASPGSPRSLHVFLDGGSFAASTPPFPISSIFSYSVEVWVRSRGLHADRMAVACTILDTGGAPLAKYRSRWLGDTPDWTRVTLGPFDLDLSQPSQAIVEIEVRAGEIPDVGAEAWFGGLRVYRMPGLRLTLDHPLGMYTLPELPTVSCRVSGIRTSDTPLSFTILNATGQTVVETSLTPNYHEIVLTEEESHPPRKHVEKRLEGSIEWRPPLEQAGFYWIRAKLVCPPAATRELQLPLTVMRASPTTAATPFGWTLPHQGHLLSLPRLAELIVQSHVGWIKYPLWFDEEADPKTIQETSMLLERLGSRGVKVVGLIVPPERVRERLSGPSSSTVGVLLSDGTTWGPSLVLSFARTASLVPFWQVGDDREPVAFDPGTLQSTLGQLKKLLGPVTAKLRLGVPWSALIPPPEDDLAFIHFQAEPPLTAEELEAYFPPRSTDQLLGAEKDQSLGVGKEQSVSAEKNQSGSSEENHAAAAGSNPPAKSEESGQADGTKRNEANSADRKTPLIFLELEPLDRRTYPMASRVRDLVLRMAAVKRTCADAAFHPNPFDPNSGLFFPNGAPSELFLPWRTTAETLGSGTYIGSVMLPSESHNHVFERQDEGVMLVWNEQPVQEVLYLGETPQVVDVWGNAAPLANSERGQVLLVDQWPRFVEGISIPITRWRQKTQLAVGRLPIVYGRAQSNRLRWENTFAVPVSGEVTITTRSNWLTSPQRFVFQLAPGELAERDFAITLPLDAEAGRHPLRVDFHVVADRDYRFSSYHFVDVGLGHVYFQLTTHLDASGDLVVHQVLINETPDPVSFRCELFAPDRRRQFCQIDGQTTGRHTFVYRFPRGEELLGKTLWLRVEEIGGSRILNYRIVASP